MKPAERCGDHKHERRRTRTHRSLSNAFSSSHALHCSHTSQAFVSPHSVGRWLHCDSCSETQCEEQTESDEDEKIAGGSCGVHPGWPLKTAFGIRNANVDGAACGSEVETGFTRVAIILLSHHIPVKVTEKLRAHTQTTERRERYDCKKVFSPKNKGS